MTCLEHLIGKQVDPTGGGTYLPPPSWEGPRWGAPSAIAHIFNSTGTLTDRILTGPSSEPLADESAQTDVVSWFLLDSEGTIRDVVQYNSGTDTTTVVDHLKYDSFGNIISQTNAAYQPQSAYTGQVWDSDAGLYWYHARWYDPHTGRFISEDPVGFAAGDINLTRYVGNSPTNFVDPTGTDLQAAYSGGAPLGSGGSQIYYSGGQFYSGGGSADTSGSGTPVSNGSSFALGSSGSGGIDAGALTGNPVFAQVAGQKGTAQGPSKPGAAQPAPLAPAGEIAIPTTLKDGTLVITVYGPNGIVLRVIFIRTDNTVATYYPPTGWWKVKAQGAPPVWYGPPASGREGGFVPAGAKESGGGEPGEESPPPWTTDEPSEPPRFGPQLPKPGPAVIKRPLVPGITISGGWNPSDPTSIGVGGNLDLWLPPRRVPPRVLPPR